MALYDEPKDPELHRLVVAAVRACNVALIRVEDERRYIGSHSDFPLKVRTSTEGWPFVDSSTFGDGPRDHGAPFGLKQGQFNSIAYDDVPELAACIDYISETPRLRLRANMGYETSTKANDLTRISASFLVTRLLDRARHQAGAEFGADVINGLYLEAEPEWVLDTLPIEIVIPILLMTFDVEGRVPISDGVALEHMDDGTNRARAYTKLYYSDANPFLLQAATHALVFEGYTMPAMGEVHRASFWPLDRIDNAFRAFEIVEDLPTGYGQVLYRPVGWSAPPKVDLPPLVKCLTPVRYPPWMTQGAWANPGSAFPTERLTEVGDRFTALEIASKAVGVASRRLGSATLRSRTDDKVIDYCIGLEALFGERGTEVTHKLATRTATALCLPPRRTDMTADEIFRAAKQVYDFRSRVVHGGESESRRRFRRADESEVDIVALARSFLRHGIAVALDRPEVLNGASIDRLMLDAVQRSLMEVPTNGDA